MSNDSLEKALARIQAAKLIMRIIASLIEAELSQLKQTTFATAFKASAVRVKDQNKKLLEANQNKSIEEIEEFETEFEANVILPITDQLLLYSLKRIPAESIQPINELLELFLEPYELSAAIFHDGTWFIDFGLIGTSLPGPDEDHGVEFEENEHHSFLEALLAMVGGSAKTAKG